MKTQLIMQLFQIISKTSCKHNHKRRKSTILLICCGYLNSNIQGAFVITFFICSNLLQLPQKPLHCSNKNGKWKEKRKSSLQAAFLLSRCISCTAIPEISSSSLNTNNTARVSRLFFRFLWLCCKTANLWDKQGCLLPFIN